MARSLWLPLALKASMKAPPPLLARANMAPRTTTQVATVRQGCLALAMAMLRVNLFMVVPLRSSGGCLMDREARQRCGERGSPHVVSDRVISVARRQPTDGSCCRFRELKLQWPHVRRRLDRGAPEPRGTGGAAVTTSAHLLQTKLFPPRTTRALVDRDRLRQRLDPRDL